MHEMKHDMSGAAAVIGAMQVIGQLKPNVPGHRLGCRNRKYAEWDCR